MGLTRYRQKRAFDRTPEPSGTSAAPGRRYVMQKHAASRLHYDLRLELDGVLLSWAVPKGASFDRQERRLAVHVEDHPLEYAGFEGVIPAGEYGGGAVIVWDEGEWEPIGDPRAGMREGHLRFRLRGRRLRGRWSLVRTSGDQWLLIKGEDEGHERGEEVLGRQTSIRTRRTLEDVAEGREAAVPDAPPAPLPDWLPPALAEPVTAPPDGDDWAHEIKLDGYRLLLRIEDGRVRVLTRGRQDWTRRFPELAAAAARLPVRSAFLDGEIVALDRSGRSAFSTLARAIGEKRTADLVYYAFDLPFLDGRDLRGLPLPVRKAALAEVVADPPPGIRLLPHQIGGGAVYFEAVCGLRLEGVVSKRVDAPYRSARSLDWRKARCGRRQELAVAGWTPMRGNAYDLGALLLTYRADGQWRYAGRAGTGFDEPTRADLLSRLETVPKASPPEGAPSLPEARWVEPGFVVEVSFTEWTPSGVLRHPVYLGIREDKRPEEVVREEERSPPDTPEPAKLTNPDRVYWPDVGVTKRDLAEWYDRVADRVVPELARRPLTLLRCPDGVGAGCFYQRHPIPGLSSAVHTVDVPGHGEGVPMIWIEDRAGLAALAQIGALEIHPWGARIAHLDQPDRLVFDLDPGPGTPWEVIVSVAENLRQLLTFIGLRSFPRLTGGAGVHVVVPLRPHATWDAVRPFCRAVAERMAALDPTHVTARMAKEERPGKVYLDYLRNTPTSTAVASWSTRARPGAPVATPIRWEEVAGAGSGARYGLAELSADVPPDPWGPLDAVDQRLDAAVVEKLARAK